MVKWKKYLCIMMSAAMMTTMAAGCGDKKDSTTEAETESKVSVEEKTEDVSALQEEIEKQVAEGDNSDADKEETVYVMADAEGNVDNVIVSNWLKNNEGTATINDKTNLTDIQNVKTNDTYVENEDGTITWQANGKDVYYQGTSNEQLPVDVKVSYKLDGKDISPAELAGKSGKVTIRFDYTNNTKKAMDVNGTSKEVVTPFVMLSGALLDADKFSNVQVENGKVISEGSRNIVVGYAVPGLKDCLDSGIDDTKIKDVLDDIDVPEYVEITADVTEFELDMTMTVAVSDVLSEAVNLDSDSIDLSDITDKVDTLTSSADQLVDGSGDLLDGLQTLKEGTYSLRDGAKTAKDGTASLKTYTSQLAAGTSQMSAGITQLTDAIGQVQSGAGALNDGAATLASGAKDLNAGVDKLYDGEGLLKNGVSQLVAGYEGKDGALAGTDALTAGASQLLAGENSLKSGLNTVISGFEDAEDGAIAGSKKVAAGAESLKAGINELLGSVTGLSDKLRTKAAGIYGQAGASSAAEVQTMMSSLEADGVIDADELGTYKALSNAYYSGTALESAASDIDSELAGAAKKVDALKKGADDLASGANDLTAGLTKLDDGVKQASEGVDELVSGTTTLKNGTTSLKNGLVKLDNGTKSLQSGIDDVITGTSSLKDGASKVSAGASTLSNKLDVLYSGSNKLAAGGKSLLTAAGTLNSGAASIYNGVVTLDNGMGTLYAGTGDLADGADQVVEGAGTLKDGMTQFNEEGIKKIAEMFSGDYSKELDFIEALFDQGTGYTNYSGILDGTSGKVKFIFETGAVEMDK